jgi:hypothetical protein
MLSSVSSTVKKPFSVGTKFQLRASCILEICDYMAETPLTYEDGVAHSEDKYITSLNENLTSLQGNPITQGKFVKYVL